MPIFEIKVIKAIAAIHKGVVNLSIKSLGIRYKLNQKRRDKSITHVQDLKRLARDTEFKARQVQTVSIERFNDTVCSLRAAENTILNLRDDLNKITA